MLRNRGHAPNCPKGQFFRSHFAWSQSNFWFWWPFWYPWHIPLVLGHHTLFVFLLSLVNFTQYCLKTPLCLLHSVISSEFSPRPFFFFFFSFFSTNEKPLCLVASSLSCFQLPYTHDLQSWISRTGNSWVWEPNYCCLLDTSLKFHRYLKLNTFKIKLSSSQTPCSSCAALPPQWTGQSVPKLKPWTLSLTPLSPSHLPFIQLLCPVNFAFYLNSPTSLHPNCYCPDLWSHHLLHEITTKPF